MIDWQSAFNLALTGLISLSAWFINHIRSDIKELRDSLHEQSQSCLVQERNIRDNYMRKDDFYEYMAPIQHQLNRIETAITQKADKK